MNSLHWKLGSERCILSDMRIDITPCVGVSKLYPEQDCHSDIGGRSSTVAV